MTPDGYRLRPGTPAILERYDSPAVTAAMTPSLRAQYIKALAQGDRPFLGAIGDVHAIDQGAIALQLSVGDGNVSQWILLGTMLFATERSELHLVRQPAGPSRTRLFNLFLELSLIVRARLIGEPSRAEGAFNRRAWHNWRSSAANERANPSSTQGICHNLLDFFVRLRRNQQSLAYRAVGGLIQNLLSLLHTAIGQEGKMQIHIERLASIADARVFPAKPFKIAIGAA
jgi:hypothetical protein